MQVNNINYEVIGDTGWGFVVQASDGYLYAWNGSFSRAVFNPFIENDDFDFILGNSGDYVILSDGVIFGDLPPGDAQQFEFQKVIPASSGFVGLLNSGEAILWSDNGVLKDYSNVFEDIVLSTDGTRAYGLLDNDLIHVFNPDNSPVSYSREPRNYNIEFIISDQNKDLFIYDTFDVSGLDTVAQNLEDILKSQSSTVTQLLSFQENHALTLENGNAVEINGNVVRLIDEFDVSKIVPVYRNVPNSSQNFKEFLYLDEIGNVLNLDYFISNGAFLELEGRKVLDFAVGTLRVALVLDDQSVVQVGWNSGLNEIFAAPSGTEEVVKLLTVGDPSEGFSTKFAALYSNGDIVGGRNTPENDPDNPFVDLYASTYDLLAVKEDGQMVAWKGAYDSVGGGYTPFFLNDLIPTKLLEDVYFEHTISLNSDIEINDLSVSASSSDAGSWLFFDQASATFMANPKQMDVGSYEVLLEIRDFETGIRTQLPVEFDVLNVNDKPNGSVSIVGTERVGQPLTVLTETLNDEDGLGEFSYQWMRDGSDISGATSSTYTLSKDDVETAISVNVSYTDGYGTRESVTSAATELVVPSDIVLSGTVSFRYTLALENILVSLDSSELASDVATLSGSDGVFEFETAPLSAGIVTADKPIDEASEEAIGAYDALQALRLAVGLTKSDGTAEWHDYLAADINKDGRVGADDALDILKFAVGLTDGAPADWIFVDGDADWSGIDRRNTDYDEGVMLEDVLVDTSINMTGILVGDLDGSYVA